MKCVRCHDLILLAISLALLLSVPVYAEDHPWDGTKNTDTIPTISGNVQQSTGGSPCANHGGGGVLNSILNWIHNRLHPSGIIAKNSQIVNKDKARNVPVSDRPFAGRRLCLERFY